MIKKIPAETPTYHFFNENPKDRRTDDCVVRAIATATNKSWEEVLQSLAEIAIKYKLMPDDPKCYDRYLTSLGWIKEKQPRKADNTKYTGNEFCKLLNAAEYQCSTVIAHIGGHHIVCIKLYDNVHKVYDTWNSTDGCIGNYWTMQGG